MAMKQAPNIGNSMVTFAVISTTRTMPTSGARGNHQLAEEKIRAQGSDKGTFFKGS
jgi:hypothetical protein